ncbi:MAG: nucleotide exchange factor GrpE [Thermoleophilaceae bacterium]|nr:nucleotide exchange factor GrpE [Thermoleophilaceae bacterium]
MAADPRKAPAEDAVREQLKQEEERVAPKEGGEPDPQEESPQSQDPSPEEEDDASEEDPGDREPGGEEDPGDREPGSEELDPEPEDPLAAAERERDEYLALAQRAQADFENYRKRTAREAAAATHRAKSGLMGELLSVVDNLERALGSAAEGEEHLADGVRLVHSELVAVLNRNGVQQFDPAGERFDPAVHEALSTREQEGSGAGLVLDVIEKGYRLNGNVLRPARVVVSAG